jgi:acyl carrier protein
MISIYAVPEYRIEQTGRPLVTTYSESQVLDDVLEVMHGLSGEWEYSGPLSPDTRFFADMEMKSLDFAILSSALVKKYGRLPFHEFYSEIAERPAEEREVTVREYSEFVCRLLAQKA